MRIWTLMENTAAREDLAAEHGLSLLIETADRRILFDAGQTAAFAKNAEKLGLDLGAVDLAVLSHGHYDHSGGLVRFLELNDCAKIYVNQYAFDCCWHGEDHYIGVDPKLRDCDRVITVGETMQLDRGLTLFACNEKEKSHPADSFGLTVWENGTFLPDTFRHEQYLLVEEGQKRILFSGCSHKGILNIVEWFRPDVLVGGFHFMKLDPERDAATLEKAAKALLRNPTVYYTGHCTGEGPFTFLKERMGERLHAVHSGTFIEL